MLEIIIPYINDKLETLNMFEKLHGLCDIINQDTKSFPAEYCQNEYKQIEFDKHRGTVYHRLTGNISTEEDDEESTISCDPFYIRTFPVRTVLGIHKKYLKNLGNDAYLENKIVHNIIRTVAESNNKILRILLKADSISFEINSCSVNRDEIFDDEYSGIENFIRYEFLYVAIDYDIIVSGNVSCFKLYDC